MKQLILSIIFFLCSFLGFSQVKLADLQSDWFLQFAENYVTDTMMLVKGNLPTGISSVFYQWKYKGGAYIRTEIDNRKSGIKDKFQTVTEKWTVRERRHATFLIFKGATEKYGGRYNRKYRCTYKVADDKHGRLVIVAVRGCYPRPILFVLDPIP